MPLSQKYGPATAAPSASSTTYRSSAQRRLPPLKQQLLQQSNNHHHHHHHSTQKVTSGGGYVVTTVPSGNSGGHYIQNNNDSNCNNNSSNNHNGNGSSNGSVNGRTGYQYSHSIRMHSTSPYNGSTSSGGNVSYLGITATQAVPSTSAASSGATSASGVRSRRPSPRVRQYNPRTTVLRSTSQPAGADLSVTGHKTGQIRSTEGGTETDRGECLTLTDLTPEIVSQYLKQNPEVLDHHVTQHVTNDRIERWLQKRTTHSHSRNPNSRIHHATTNGEHNSEKPLALTRWKSQLQASKGKVLQELSKDLHLTNGKTMVLLELAECVTSAVSADSYTLFSCESSKQEITHISKDELSGEAIFGVNERIGLGTSVAASVAYTKEPKRLKDLLGEKRYADGLTVSNNKAHCVMGLPILDDEDTCFGVVEFYRHTKQSYFTDEEEEVGCLMLQWFDMLVDYAQTHSAMMRQRALSDFLLEVTKSIFQDIVSMDVVIMKIMNFAKALVHADRASLFLLDTRSNELYARIFDDGCSLDEHVSPIETKIRKISDNEDSMEKSEGEKKDSSSEEDGKREERKKKKEEEKEKEKTDKPVGQYQDIRFSMDKGVAGYVASTGKILNIKDAYKDSRFNPDVDIRTGYKTKTILCMPIFIKGVVIGVVQMVNKLQGTFTKADEEAFETFAIYCGLALHHAKLYEKIRRSEQKYRVALDVLSYHSQATVEEVNDLRRKRIPWSIPNITNYNFSPWDVMDDEKPLYCLYMFKQLFTTVQYDMDDLIRFTLTVRKNYRNVPYHNWTHAFSVAHSMFTILTAAKHSLTPVEGIALFVACLCHDLDHRGKTNQFMVQSASPLAAIYSTSTMEHHHFNQTVTILQNEGHNIFKFLTSDEYKKVLSDVKQSILATDLVVFFKNKASLQTILDKSTFNWDTVYHRTTLTALSMTACDLCAMYKPWALQQKLVYIIMEEFWQQGDEEKKRGFTPMQMMDRDKQDELPNLEVGFIQSICIPCYDLMSKVMPDTKPMLEGAQANLVRWKELADKLVKNKGGH